MSKKGILINWAHVRIGHRNKIFKTNPKSSYLVPYRPLTPKKFKLINGNDRHIDPEICGFQAKSSFYFLFGYC